ncbi:hypothetical protein MNBD_ALPHA04-1047 [hydrothermal vent metagenome]|uniref:HTH tetR-type domain-containing protein n=1 Tax=hydrothermal vent metagenome TaxID=652676 RepID=A0A3B0SLX4_9ZZZZ
MRKGERRKKQILDVCVQLLVEKGYSELSFRSVATRAGIQIGNLQYYFPTRADLIRAMLTREIDRYHSEFDDWGSDEKAQNPQDTLLKTIDYLLGDQKTQNSCIVIWELWALAAHDVDAASLMNEYYQTYLSSMTELIRKMRLDLTPARANRISLLIVAMIEGASLFRGYQKPRIAATRGIEKDIKSAIISLIENA